MVPLLLGVSKEAIMRMEYDTKEVKEEVSRIQNVIQVLSFPFLTLVPHDILQEMGRQ